MLIIPVIDLSNGIVVHAICGKRNSYQPIASTISDNCQPESILSAFLKLYPFKVIYIADLDAIQGNGNQLKLINKFALKYKECEFWVDAGLQQILARKSNITNKNIKFILGSENNIALQDYQKIIKKNPDILLSLDFNEKGLINNSYLLNNSSIWPNKVIIMMLHRVGSSKGIDRKYLKNIISLNKNSEIYLAGGINDSNDIRSLNSRNIKGCLIATALHQQKITKKELNLFFNM